MIVNTDKNHRNGSYNTYKAGQITDEDKNLNITMQGKQIKTAAEETLLDVIIDSNLSWKAQIQKVRRSVLLKLSVLRKIYKYLPTQVRILYYSYYVKPHLQYCSSIWGHCSKKKIWKLSSNYKKKLHVYP